jgi:hypothetical protein
MECRADSPHLGLEIMARAFPGSRRNRPSPKTEPARIACAAGWSWGRRRITEPRTGRGKGCRIFFIFPLATYASLGSIHSLDGN